MDAKIIDGFIRSVVHWSFVCWLMVFMALRWWFIGSGVIGLLVACYGA
jgi:hypothetical protein